MARFLLTCIVALAGAILFAFLHMPIPWLLGPMTAVLIGSKLGKLPLAWPGFIRDAGILLVGYSMGLSLTGTALVEIVRQLPSMLMMTVTLILFCTIIAYLISKLSGIDFPTMMTASIPGGLTQMLTLAEEIKQIDVTVVTFFQVTRLIMLVFSVPLLLFSPLLGGEHLGAAGAARSSLAAWDALFPNILAYIPLCLLCALAGKKLKLPTAYMLGPMLGTAAVNLSGFHGPALPSPILNLSQFMIGTYVGLLLQPGQLERKARTISLAILSVSVLILVSLGLTALVSHIHSLTLATGFLALAPGGMDQMGIMAHETGADLSIVSGYQTFRLLFIYFVVPPTLKALFKLVAKRAVGRADG